MKQFLEILKEWNGGIFRGSQARLAKELGLTQNSIKMWAQGLQTPSELNIKKMAKLFKMGEESLKLIFNPEALETELKTNKDIPFPATPKDTNIIYPKAETDRALDEVLKRIEKMELSLKLLDAKIDLILEKLKDRGF
jgi:transcriptional regulator with XRE-family HTH domain